MNGRTTAIYLGAGEIYPRAMTKTYTITRVTEDVPLTGDVALSGLRWCRKGNT
ncbi:hypothetical protein G6M89_01725 [Natronolimnobius sp. AArcel1]|uniref:hypothetical protein n=1 Tax=Natronolimnobius sp. AArcel1 TaxID=1679093 RepID=UPI0013EC130B|nr:hypothetical protein [Natronolimnobius sp. AArcel1]NGM67739.1 hypothetical protein [Natronolimnobius sp. AArcel1]